MDAQDHVTSSIRGRMVAGGLVALLALAGGAEAKLGVVHRGGETVATAASTTAGAAAAQGPYRYRRLRQLGVGARDARLGGRLVGVRISNRRPVEIRLAVIRGRERNLQAWDAVRLRPGTRTLTRRLNRTPTGSNLNLRVTARIGAVMAREIIALKRAPAPPSNNSGSSSPPSTPPGNSAPSALALSNSSVAENQPAGTTVGTLSATDANPADTLSFALVGGTGSDDNAAFALAGSTLQTAAAFDTETKSGYAVRVRVSDGSGATFERALTITVTNVNDAPGVTTSAGGAANTEGATTTLDGALTVGDQDDANLESATVRVASGLQAGDELVFAGTAAITGTFDGATGVLTLTGTATKADYQAALRSVGYRHTADDPSSSKTIAFRVNDGEADSAAATKTIAVTAVNDAPVLGTTAPALTYAENAGAVTVDPIVTVADPDSTQLTGARVRISANHVAAQDSLGFANQLGITGSYVPATGVLTLSGTASVADYRTALRSVAYTNSSDDPSTAQRTVAFRVSDGTLDSTEATRAITITAADDPPVASGDLASVAEDSGATTVAVLTNDADVDGGPRTVGSVTQPADGTVVISGGGTGLTYAPKADYCNSPLGTADTFTYALNGGSAATVAITVTCVNDAPVITTGGTLNYTEAAPATAVDDDLLLDDADADPDTATITGATVRITGNHASPQDVLALPAQPIVTAAYNSATGTLTLSGTDTVARYRTALRAVTYRNASNNPSNATRTVTYTATDGLATSAPATRDISVTASDDAPDVDNSAGALAYTENDPATAVDTAIAVSDPDSANLTGATVQITGSYIQGQDILALPAQPVVTALFDAPSGRLTLSGTATIAAYETALEAVTYGNTSDDPSTAPRTLSYQARDAGGFGAADTHGVTITAVDDPPAAIDDSATVSEDSGASAIAVLANDTDVDGGPKTVGSVTQPANGTVVITGGGTGLTYAPQANYCNDPPGTTPGTFTYTLSGGDTATVSMTVTCGDDPPTAVNDSATVAEDAGATAVTMLSNDTDVDGGPKTVASASDPANGTVVLTGGSAGAHTGLTYRPETDYCNDPPGTTLDTFTYTLNGGSTGTVAVTVTCGDDDPVAVDDGATVNEDSGANAIAVLGNDTDIDGGSKSVVSVTQPTSGTVVITGGGTGLTYAPDDDYCNTPPGGAPDTFTYTLNGGDDGSVSVTVTCAGDAPVVDTTTTALSYTENDAATAIDPGVTVSDVDAGATISGATVQITANFASGEDLLALSNAITHPLITATAQVGGTLTLTGSASPAAYQAALADVTYANSSDATSAPARTVTFAVTGDGGLTGSDTRSIQIVAADDPPAAVGDSATVAEDDAATAVAVLTNDTDVDGGPRTITSASDPAHGTVVLTGGAPGAHTGLTYRPDLNYCNDPAGFADTFTYTINGGSTATASMTVTCVDDIPVADDDGATVNEDAGATAVSVLTNDSDGDGGTITIASASDPANGTVALTGGSAGAHTGLTYQPEANYCNDPPGTTPDTFTYSINGGDAATVSVTVTCSDDAPVAVNDSATVAEDSGATAVTVLANDTDIDGGPKTIASATDPAHGTVVLTGGAPGAHTGLTYQPDDNDCNDPPATTPDTFTYTINGASSATVSMTVTCVDDPPTAVNDAASVLEDAAATAIPVLTNDTDTDGGPKTIASASDPANGTVVLTGGAPGAHSGLTYQPDPNDCNDPPATTPDTFTYTLTGGSNATVSITVTCVNDAPNADDETFNGADSAVGNTTFIGDDTSDGAPGTPDPTDTSPVSDRPHKTISADILAGDTDADGPGPLTVTPGTFASDHGGTVTLQSDGDFTFEPAASTSCSDTSDHFDYTVEDSGSPEQTDTGTVTIAISGCAWYVNNDDAQGNSGTSEQPFDTLAQAESASDANHSIFVYDGANTSAGYTTGITLKSGQKLIGEAAALTAGSATLHSADAANQPTLTDNNADVVELDDGNTVRGLNIDPQGTGGGIAGAAGDSGGATIDDVDIVDTGTAGQQPGLELDATTGTFDVSNLTVDNTAATAPTSGSIGVRLNSAGTVNFASAGTISVHASGARALDATSTNMGSGSVFDDLVATGSGTGGVNLASTTGTTQLGNGSASDLDLTTTSGSTPALNVSNGGTVSVPGGGTANLSATGGPAVDITGTSGASFDLDAVSSTNSAGDGINLDGIGTFSATGGSIGGAAGVSFDLNGGSGAITYPGSLNNGVGLTAVDISGRSGGAVSLSGAISDTSDAGGTIKVTGNSGGSTTLSGMKQANTGASDGVLFNGSDGHTLNLTGGGLEIDTTSGKGLEAGSSGTISVTGFGNTIDSTTGRALHVSDTDIGTSDLTFEKIASNGAANGIRLNNTANASGSLTVTGSGGSCTSAGTCSGGAIQNSTGSGVDLNSVPGGVSLTRSAISASVDDGVHGSGVSNGFNLDSAWINNNGNTPNAPGGGVHGDHGIDFTGLTGTSAFTNSNVSNNIDSNVVVSDASGTLNLNVTGGTYSGAGGGMGDGIYVEGTGTGSQNLNVQGPITFANNVGSHVQHGGDPTSTADSDVTVNNATMSSPAGGGSVLGGGITINEGGPTSGGGSNTDVMITNNNIQNSVIGAIAVGTTGSVTNQQIANVDATIANNTIGAAGVAGSGSVQGNGIFVDSNGNSLVRTVIAHNTIRQWTNRSAIALDVLDGDAEMSATVESNVLTEPNAAFAGTSTRGMTLQLGTAQAGDSVDVCLDIGDGANSALKNQVFGTGEAPQPDVRYLHEGQGSSVQLVGYAGPSTPAIANIASWLQPRNNIGGTPTVTGIPSATGSSTTASSSCPQPSS